MPKDVESVALTVYLERKRSFLASLDIILRQIGCLNRRDIIKLIDDTVNSNLSSEREAFLTKITNLVTKDTDHTKSTFDLMCTRLINIVDQCTFQESSVRNTVSKIKNRNLTNITDQPIIDLLMNQLSHVSQIRCEIGILKASVLSIISSFLSSITQNRQQMKSLILKVINETNMRNQQLEIQLKLLQKAAKEREQKLAFSEQKLSELNDQVVYLKQQRASNARMTQLERQLAEKTRLFEEQKQQSDAIISELEQELEDKTIFLEEQRRSSNAQIFQLEQHLDSQLTKKNISIDHGDEIDELESQIIERDKIIEQQKKSSQSQISQLQDLLENLRQKSIFMGSQLKSKDIELEQMKTSLSNYESQLSQRTDEITMLEAEKTMSQGAMTLAELDDLKQETQEKDEEIHQLKNQLETMNSFSRELDTLRGSYLRKSQEVDELKRTAETAQKEAIELENKNRSLTQAYKALELQLSHGTNEQTSLQCDIDHALMICQIRKKKIKQLKKENESLRSQTLKFQKMVDEKGAEIYLLRSNTDDVNLETSYLKQQLSVSQTDSDRNNSLVFTMKEKLANAMSILQEKEKVIDEMIEMDKQKTNEISLLNSQLSNLQKDSRNVKSKLELINKTQQINEQQNIIKSQEEQIKSLTVNLSQVKANIRSLELTSKEQQLKIKDLATNLKESRHTIKLNENEIHRLLELTSELTKQHSSISEQSDVKINTIMDQTDKTTLKLEKLSRKNISLTQTISQLQGKINILNSEIESIKSNSIQLKTENLDLIDQIKTKISPLQQENEELRKKILKYTTQKQQQNESIDNIEYLYKELKLQSQSKINLLEKKVNDLNYQLQQAKSNYDENISQLEKHFESMNIKLRGSNSSKDEYSVLFQELQHIFDVNSFESILKKSTEKINECDSMKKELADIKQKAEQTSKVLFEKEKKVETLANEVNQLLNTVKQLKESVNDVESEKSQLNTKIERIKYKLKNEREEHETTKICFDELRDDLASFKNIIDFDSLSNLKVKLTKMIEANSIINENSFHANTTIQDLETLITKLKKENNDNSALIKEQNQQICQLSKNERNLKNEVLLLSKNTNMSTFELQNQLQKTKDQLMLISSSITKLHEVISFSQTDDIYVVVSSIIRQKDQKINDLQHQLKMFEVSSNDSYLKIGTKSKKIEEQQNEIIKLKNEQLEMKREKQLLEDENAKLTKLNTTLKSEFDQKNIHISKIQAQVSLIVDISSIDELPTALYGYKEEFELEKQKNQLLRENNQSLKDKLKESDKNLEIARLQLYEHQHIK